MSFPRYPKYKPSGVEWLGDVPVGWEVKPLRSVFKFSKGLTITKENLQDEGVSCVNYGEIHSKYGFRLNPAIHPLRCVAPEYLSSNPEALIRDGDFVFADTSEDLEGSGNFTHLRSDDPIFAGYHTIIARPRKGTCSLLLAYQIHSSVFRSQVKGVKVFSISQGILKGAKCWLPPLPEQTAIAKFLDRETGKIDGLVAEQRRLMELLKEKRQAVISHAVTKGLNPHAPMKPSGNLWLGDVPDHWEVGKVKHYFSTCSGGTPNTGQQSLYYSMEGDGFPWVRTTDLNNDFVATVPVYITEQAIKDTACAVLPQGTVMVAMYGGDGTVGKNGLLMFPATINQAVCGLLPSETHDNEYVFRFIQFYRPYWMIGAESSRTDPNISQDRVKNAPFPKPPIAEQHDIVQFLNEKLATFDGLIAEAQRTIDLLQERRTALISAAVTGQIDVRA